MKNIKNINMINENFCVFILTHGRPDNVITFDTLKKSGYTGKIYLVIDNEDSKSDKYIEKFEKENVIIFDKKEVSKTFDEFDNFENRGSIVYARNVCFDLAKDLGIKYFLQLDDDYTAFDYRLYIGEAVVKPVRNLDLIFKQTLDFYKSINVCSIAFAQGGDFIGGLDNGKEIFRFNKRKAMNTFFCSTDRKFQFTGRINEDVNTYTNYQSKGNVFLTIANISITQKTTQSNKGGMTETYLEGGTYIKSFYSVICAPDSVRIKMINSSNRRLHHSIKWENAVPKIITQKHKKI